VAAKREKRRGTKAVSLSGQAGVTPGSVRRGLGRGLGAILPARTAVPLALVGLGARAGLSMAVGEEFMAPARPTDHRRFEPDTTELAPPSRLNSHADLVAGLEQALAGSRRVGRPVAVVVLGVDGFRHVNAAFGREAGDAMLRALGERLLRDRRREDLVGRLEGDEFAVVCAQVDSALGARRAVERLLADLDAPVLAGGVELRLRATFGLALAVPGEDGVPARTMLCRAQLAKQRAKEAGLRWAVFTPGRDGYQRPRWNTSSDARRGLEVDEVGRSSPPGRPIRTAPT
jgi:diguanylate cyclase (GGDEF)-like protein